ncbi:MAG: hypothetical protein KDE55_12395 [Novosphingobium sp.]|nr:hypothetical protein [Novosphingobium sp.]
MNIAPLVRKAAFGNRAVPVNALPVAVPKRVSVPQSDRASSQKIDRDSRLCRKFPYTRSIAARRNREYFIDFQHLIM